MMNSGNTVFLLVAVAVAAAFATEAEAAEAMAVGLPRTNLKWHYYKVHKTCKDAEVYVRHQVEMFYKTDKGIAPQLLRLLYSDCFVTGCDASILLDGPNSEKAAPQNRGLGGFVLVDKIKTVLEQRCPGVVSCADILNLATRDAVHMAGAPSYPVFTGRRDGMSSSKESVDLPSPSITWEKAYAYFKSKGLNVLDMATLIGGGHSMGRTHCSYLVDRFYNFAGTGKPDPTMDSAVVSEMRKLCPPRAVKGQTDPLVYINPESGPDFRFTNSSFSRILSHKAVLGVDQQLLYNDDTNLIAAEFAGGFEDLRKSFALSVSRMGSINVLTGNQGEIRRNCRYTNKQNPQ